jgi:RimJ/RimL family protein N-acetyltransferase
VADLPERIPVEHPDGIVLRRARVTDADAIAAAVRESLEHLARFMPWANEQSCDPAFQAERLRGVEDEWDTGEELQYLLVRATDESRVIGSVGVMTRMGPRTRELGYWVHADDEGRGYIRAACATLTDRCLALADVERVLICCDPDNARSATIPLGLGYSDDGLIEDHPVCGTSRIFTATR